MTIEFDWSIYLGIGIGYEHRSIVILLPFMAIAFNFQNHEKEDQSIQMYKDRENDIENRTGC